MGNVPGGQTEEFYVRVNATADGDNTVIPAVALKRIRVISYAVLVTSSGTLSMQGTDNVVHASFPFAANGGVSYGGPTAAFETNVGCGLEVSTAGGQDAGGHLTYQVV